MATSCFRAAAALTFAFVAASCGGGDGGTGPTFSDSVSTADAQAHAGQAVIDIGLSIGQLNFGGGSLGLAAPALIQRHLAERPFAVASMGGHTLRRELRIPDWRTLVQSTAGLQASAAEGCTLTESGYGQGGVVDVDQNGFPDNLYYRLECVTTDSTSNADTTYVDHLLVEEHVKQNFGTLYGFDISINQVEKYSDGFGNFESFEIGGTEALDIRGGSAGHRVNLLVKEGMKFDTASAAYEFGLTWNVGFTPSGTIVLGDPLPNGSVTISGREYVTDTEDQNLSFALETTTPLAYSWGCFEVGSNPPFTAGVLRGLLNANANSASFTATFTGCGVAPTISTNGTHDPAPVAAR